ncbi:MAG: hypothetical protein OXH51_11265 [Gemmatimonadetes bacterium]|nr:hypothetical protein [Gemmatimonadota bacterium]MCY3612103.1 hypothetical protein [Gemmatimonadota bacterium]MCY3676405.1 hypothetical protein [Gemmatimonadota bacterium]MYA43897.1 ribbon-helix-helix protein, CopG family [Gemmatimonadota bacterium]MYE94319.1 ribbon-helix-helix protein, CopG family [Gemmatimonadota bacterium]
MSTRTVRMDDASEATLADLQRRTGLSISEVMRRGLRAYERELDADITRRPYEVYQSLGLPREGESALAPAAKAKEAIADVIRKRHEQ